MTDANLTAVILAAPILFVVVYCVYVAYVSFRNWRRHH